MTEDRPLLKSTGPGSAPTVHYRGRYLYSSKNPQAAPARLAVGTPLFPDTLVFIPSLGLGYGLPELLGRLPAGCHVLVVECDPALWELAAAVRDRFALEARLTLLPAANLAPIREFLDARPAGGFRRVTTILLCAAGRLFPEFYRAVEQCLSEEIQVHWQNRMTLIHMGGLYVKNLFANLTLLERSGDLAGLALDDRPVVAVGAGPSLDGALPVLRRLASRAALLAVDTALPVLAAAGLTPHFTVALEPQFVNLKDFYGLPPGSTTLLADLASAPQAVRFCLDRACPVRFFSSRFAPLELWARLARAGLLPLTIPPLGSVGVAAVWLALRLTRGPVFLCGFDLAYSHRRTHAAGSPSALADGAAARRLHPVGQREFAALCARPRVTLKDKRGAPVETDLVLSSYARHLSALTRPESRVFDLGAQGLALGAPLIEHADEALRLAGTGTTEGGPTTTPDVPAAWRADHIGEFLGEERRLLGESRNALAAAAAPGRPENGVLDPAAFAAVRATDYAYLPLAGKTAFPEYTRSYAARALLEVDILSERIRRVLADIR